MGICEEHLRGLTRLVSVDLLPHIIRGPVAYKLRGASECLMLMGVSDILDRDGLEYLEQVRIVLLYPVLKPRI
jgi:hypothetical protein